MATYQLSTTSLSTSSCNDQQYDFILIGIICQHKDYKLCYELNRKLDLNLVKCEDYELYFNVRKAKQLLCEVPL